MIPPWTSVAVIIILSILPLLTRKAVNKNMRTLTFSKYDCLSWFLLVNRFDQWSHILHVTLSTSNEDHKWTDLALLHQHCTYRFKNWISQETTATFTYVQNTAIQMFRIQTFKQHCRCEKVRLYYKVCLEQIWPSISTDKWSKTNTIFTYFSYLITGLKR